MDGGFFCSNPVHQDHAAGLARPTALACDRTPESSMVQGAVSTWREPGSLSVSKSGKYPNHSRNSYFLPCQNQESTPHCPTMSKCVSFRRCPLSRHRDTRSSCADLLEVESFMPGVDGLTDIWVFQNEQNEGGDIPPPIPCSNQGSAFCPSKLETHR